MMNQSAPQYREVTPEPMTATSISQLRKDLGDLSVSRQAFAEAEQANEYSKKFDAATDFCEQLQKPLQDLLAVENFSEVDADDVAFGLFTLLQRNGTVHRTDLLILVTGGIALRDVDNQQEYFGYPTSELRQLLEKRHSVYSDELAEIGVNLEEEANDVIPVVKPSANNQPEAEAPKAELSTEEREFIAATLSRPARAQEIRETAESIRQKASAVVEPEPTPEPTTDPFSFTEALQSANEGIVYERELSVWNIPLLGEGVEYRIIATEDGENILSALNPETNDEWTYSADEARWVPLPLVLEKRDSDGDDDYDDTPAQPLFGTTSFDPHDSWLSPGEDEEEDDESAGRDFRAAKTFMDMGGQVRSDWLSGNDDGDDEEEDEPEADSKKKRPENQ